MTPAVHATDFGLIRHGQTAWNADKRIQGQTDTVLSDKGITQAGAWAISLATMGWTRILCSDLSRAGQTAAVINATLGGLPVTTDPRLREQDWGRWVGRTIAQLRLEEHGEVERQEAAGWHFTPTGGESRIALLHRVREAVIDCADRYPDEKVLVITHLGCIKALMHHLQEKAFHFDEADLINKYGLHRIRCSGGQLSIIDINGAL